MDIGSIVEAMRLRGGELPGVESLGVSANAIRKRLAPLRAAGLVTVQGGRGGHTTYHR